MAITIHASFLPRDTPDPSLIFSGAPPDVVPAALSLRPAGPG